MGLLTGRLLRTGSLRYARGVLRPQSEVIQIGYSGMGVGRVREIWRYPVKSMAGERLESSHANAALYNAISLPHARSASALL